MKDRLRVGVVGTGHFGRHHVRIYSELDDVELVGICDIDARRARELADQFSTVACTDHRELLGKVDAVSVAVPTVKHLVVAGDFLKEGVSVLVEKPIAQTAAEAREMVKLAEAGGARLQVGHVNRFSPAVIAMREMKIQPRFLEVHRLSAFSFRSLDVGVVLDLMIHDIDLVLTLVDGNVTHVDAVGFALIGKTEDICNARLRFDNGCVVNMTASRVSLKTMRKIRIFSPDGYISLDFDINNALLIKKSENFSLDALDIGRIAALPMEELKKIVFGGFLQMKEMKLDELEPLKEELSSFVDCVKNETCPLVPGEDGVRSMETAEWIIASAREHDWSV